MSTKEANALHVFHNDLVRQHIIMFGGKQHLMVKKRSTKSYFMFREGRLLPAIYPWSGHDPSRSLDKYAPAKPLSDELSYRQTQHAFRCTKNTKGELGSRELLWEASAYKYPRRYLPYRAPSWSWASVDCSVNYVFGRVCQAGSRSSTPIFRRWWGTVNRK